MNDHQQNRPLVFRTSNKLTLQYSLLYSLLVVVVFVFAFFLSRFEMTDWALDLMRDDAPAFQEILARDGETGLVRAVDTAAKINLHRSRIYGLFDADGTHIAGGLSLFPPQDTPLATHDQLGLDHTEFDEPISYWLRIDEVGDYTIVQGTSDEVISELLEPFVIALLSGFFLLIALGLYLGRRVGRITEKRVLAISGALDAASTGNFAARIKAEPRGDDLWLVENEIDRTLSKLSNAVAAQKQVSIDIAHDLRSPLQRVRQNVERLVEGTDFEERKVRALQNIDELSATFQSLLDIAGLSNGTHLQLERVPVEDMVQVIEELYLPEFSASGIQFSSFVDPEVSAVSGDKNLLLQMIGNLIENCLKYCAAGDEVTLRIVKRSGKVDIRVEDGGPGIPADHHDRALCIASAHQSDGYQSLRNWIKGNR